MTIEGNYYFWIFLLTSARSVILCLGSKTLRTNPAKSTLAVWYFVMKGCKRSCKHKIIKIISYCHVFIQWSVWLNVVQNPLHCSAIAHLWLLFFLPVLPLVSYLDPSVSKHQQRSRIQAKTSLLRVMVMDHQGSATKSKYNYFQLEIHVCNRISRMELSHTAFGQTNNTKKHWHTPAT